jgi:hypothetical protein
MSGVFDACKYHVGLLCVHMVLFNGTLSVVELLIVIASKSPYLADRVFSRQQTVLFLSWFIHCEDRTFFTLNCRLFIYLFIY